MNARKRDVLRISITDDGKLPRRQKRIKRMESGDIKVLHHRLGLRKQRDSYDTPDFVFDYTSAFDYSSIHHMTALKKPEKYKTIFNYKRRQVVVDLSESAVPGENRGLPFGKAAASSRSSNSSNELRRPTDQPTAMDKLKIKIITRKVQNTKRIQEASVLLENDGTTLRLINAIYERLNNNNEEFNKMNEDIESNKRDEAFKKETVVEYEDNATCILVDLQSKR
ncbi:hypothetical protein HPB51_029436 [Rhipicephalus microplus]|uniref:Uncharacterized protein n=1 Tax=Rhipicephalus microplus TaxID=6941 RepID=A0A9J6CUI3_RHIMP|nr:hypothetical protein HPB51_029436 [Rhipicephalus microplus]